jgi:2-C-methyl-D-erythritol 2,4-cyclodiphosphate synthase
VVRIGLGYDIHRLSEGRRLVVGGVEIPHEKGPEGHSDGDVLIHAIIDAILGASAMGDIGTHFPDSEAEYKDIASTELLKRTGAKVAKVGRLEYLDSVVVIERPKLMPHIVKIRRVLAGLLEMPEEKISIKAKTAEGLGAVGKEEAIEAYAVAMVDM